ncbi:hypothetical protein ASPWEDRAFT_67296 [Aspergillus wentii DTO 134E9]|uniref:Low temperature requirement protein A n=1 Tax=Aspergillus wentii DTO 134E9 TaxID=1073089 RepID=A0A1L9RPY6_ASPWE|nr:uncharacterized protein ASPWEDRAFT_67296 [Aspergillus wentii DTO 134E9]OJJ36984.1 hypothetical protein ASPWEDRAFT_67296 [Aspergillus wentii DTO 134E9]
MEAHNLQPNPRFLFRQPLALQWFENGKLVKRSEEERQAGRFELFLDLLYVAILANFADTLAEDISGVKVVKYILILAPSWHVWSDLREIMNSFYNDDFLQRILILWVMAVLMVYGNNASLVDEDIGALRSTVGAYMVARLSCNIAQLYYSFGSYHHRPQQRLWVALSTACLFIYIPLYVDTISLRHKIAVAAVAVVLEECVWVFCYSPIAKRMLKAKYTTAVDIAHEIDRFAAFYIIALGEFLYWSIVGSPAAIGFNTGLLRAVWTLVIAFCLNWIYVHNDGSLHGTHPLRHSIWTAFSWATLHLPLIASLLAGGHVAALSAKEDQFGESERWLLCGSIGVGLFCLWGFGLLYADKDEPGTLMLNKHFRIIMRPIVGIVIICLPLADGEKEVTTTMSTMMALIVFCLIWENVTSLRRDCQIWEKWENTNYPEKVMDGTKGSG